MKRRLRVTIRMGWIEEIETTESSIVQREEELLADLSRVLHPDGKMDIAIREER